MPPFGHHSEGGTTIRRCLSRVYHHEDTPMEYRKTSRPWLDNLTISVWSPGLRREVLISPNQYRLMVTVFAGWSGHQRALAAATGYSIAGLNGALHQLRRLGLVVTSSTRGRLGSTYARVRKFAKVIERHVLNVRQHLVDISRSGKRGRETKREWANISVLRVDRGWHRAVTG